MLHTLNRVASTTFRARHVRGAVKQLTCDQANCSNRQLGWMIILPVPTKQMAVDFIRAGKTGKRFTEKVEGSGMVTFYFDAGQDCFEKHMHRDPVFNIGRKDTGGRLLLYPDGDAFIEDSDRHLRKLKEAIDG